MIMSQFFTYFMMDPWPLFPLVLFTGMAIIAWKCSPGISSNFFLISTAIMWWFYAAWETHIYFWRQAEQPVAEIRIDLLFIAIPIAIISLLALLNFLIVLTATIIRLIRSNHSAHANSSARTTPKGPLRSWQDADDPKN